QFGASYEAFLNVVHPDDLAMVNQAYTDSVRDKTPYDIVHRLLLPEQRIKYVREWCETFYDQDGHPLRSVGTSQDVTERILNEHKILRLNNFYAALSRANEAIARSGDRDTLFQELCNIAVEHGQFKLAWIGLVDEPARTVNVAAFSGEASGYLDNIQVSIDADRQEGRGPIGTTVRNNTETILNDFLHDPSSAPWHESAGKYGLLAAAACPLSLDGKVVGVLMLYAGETNYFDQELANLLSDLSRDITFALNNFAREAQRKQAEEMLRESEEKFRTLVENLPERVFVKNADLVFTACNEQLARDLGIKPEEIVGKTDYDFFPEKLAEMYQENDRLIMCSGQVESFEERIVLEGEERYISTIKAPYRDNQGKIVGVIGAFWDITERRLLAEIQRKSTEEIEDLYENAPCGYHSLDGDGTIIRINHTELQWLGYTREEVVGKLNFADLHTAKSQRKFRKNFVLFKEQGSLFDQEYELIRKDGSVFPVILNATAVFDADGRFLMSRSTLHDITERKFAQEALQESELLFRTMVDNAPMIIWVSDASRGNSYQGFNFFNRRWHEFTGHTLDGSQGHNWAFYVHPDDRERCLANYQEAFRQALPFQHEYRLLRHDGVYRWMDDSGVPRFMEGGKFLGHIGICVDITEQKEFEAMRAQMEHAGRLNIAGEMASGIAHELSQPLTACNNYLDGCLRRMDDSEWDKDKLRNAVQLACKQASRAGKIINHLKGLVRKQGHERGLIDLNTLIEDVITFLEDEVRHHRISVNMALCELPKITGSKVEIEQVFLNLCKNAIEAMSGCSRRELHISTSIVDAGHIQVDVRDTGTGFLPDEAENLFNPFHTSKKDGLGLGLAICRSFIENHGGKIWAEPQLESGAKFCFTLSVRGDKDYA
ncbi:MAG TPA: PAS domain S-box protein, partial [Gallionella sp.]|nr:PAS domain S-box protein [Gallionella sp.]